MLAHISIQINFWIIAFLLLSAMMYLSVSSMVETHRLDIDIHYIPIFFSAIAIGIVYGSILGFIDFQLEKPRKNPLSLGRVVVIRSIWYFLTLFMIMGIIRYVFWEGIFIKFFYDSKTFPFRNVTWQYIFIILAIYTLVLAPGISFINQVNKKFGPGVLLPMLFGKYKNPVEEERLIMMLDMKSSTTHAEVLGHQKYSALVRDCFLDINSVIYHHQAQIYQYVGDEVVVSWLYRQPSDAKDAVHFYFDVQKRLESRSDYYQTTYGHVPLFKAGAHLGLVVAVEVGDIKREIAYHGDTINTAARIQGLCNQYHARLLVSEIIASALESPYVAEKMGKLELKGKQDMTTIYRIMVNG